MTKFNKESRMHLFDAEAGDLIFHFEKKKINN
jgi:hypothetical protein